MNLTEQKTFVSSEATHIRVGLVAARAALLIQAESAAATNHAVRAALATKVLQAPKDWAYPFTVAVATRQNLTAEPTDPELVQAVQAVWNGMAGAPGPA